MFFNDQLGLLGLTIVVLEKWVLHYYHLNNNRKSTKERPEGGEWEILKIVNKLYINYV